MMNEEKKLQVKDLTISFRTINGKVQAVRDISFDLYKGETLAIVGESGSGKSVTSKAILGISAGNAIVENGEILYDGKDLLKITEEDFHAIGQWIRGARRYFLQAFTDRETVPFAGFHAPGADQLAAYLAIVSAYVEEAHIRGVD